MFFMYQVLFVVLYKDALEHVVAVHLYVGCNFNYALVFSDVIPTGSTKQVSSCIWHLPEEGTVL